MKINYGQYESYLHGDKLSKLVERSEERLKELDFDTIAVCGISGLLVGSPLAMTMGKSLLVVRKPNEPARGAIDSGWFLSAFGVSGSYIQSALSVIGSGENQKILLVDDHVSTGATLGLMVSAIDARCTNPAFLGLFLYGEIFKPPVFTL